MEIAPRSAYRKSGRYQRRGRVGGLKLSETFRVHFSVIQGRRVYANPLLAGVHSSCPLGPKAWEHITVLTDAPKL